MGNGNVTKQQFDADLQSLATDVNALIAAIQQPDFSAEDASVQTLIANIQAALPPPPQSSGGTSQPSGS